jgi:hypothetical protein
MRRQRIAEASKGVGKAKVGGPFTLMDQDGRTLSDEDLKGKYSLVCATCKAECYSVVGGGADRSTGLLWLHALPRHLS